MPKVPSSKSRRRSSEATKLNPDERPLNEERVSKRDSATNTRTEQKPLPPRMRHAQKVNDDIRGMFPRLQLTEQQWQKLERRMRAPYDLSPGAPTQDQLMHSTTGEYYFGFYLTERDIREFGKRHNPHRTKTDGISLDDFLFLTQALSLIMNGWRGVVLQRAVISEWHKENIGGIEEEVGENGYVLVVLTSDEYEDGYKPSNREVRELRGAVKREPCWWEAFD